MDDDAALGAAVDEAERTLAEHGPTLAALIVEPLVQGAAGIHPQPEYGSRHLITQVTFYDPIGLVKPLSAVYTHDARPDLEEAGVRIRNWQCETSSNSYKDNPIFDEDKQ